MLAKTRGRSSETRVEPRKARQRNNKKDKRKSEKGVNYMVEDGQGNLRMLKNFSPVDRRTTGERARREPKVSGAEQGRDTKQKK